MRTVDTHQRGRTRRSPRQTWLHTSARTFHAAPGTLGLLASGGLAAAAVRPSRPGPWPAPAEPASAAPRWPARRLTQAPGPAPGAGSGVDWDALTHEDLTLTPRQLDALRSDWHFDGANILHDMAAGMPHVGWGSVDQPLFGPADAGLQGGAAGAAQLAGLDEDLNGIGGACATFAARFPHLLPQRVVQNGSSVTVHLQIKLSDGSGFRDFPITVDATLPVRDGTQALASRNPQPNSTWALYVTKAIWSVSSQPGSFFVPDTFAGTLQSLMGREVEEVGLTRLADLRTGFGPTSEAERAVPSVRFDLWMQRLGDIRCGGLVFRSGGQLPQSPAYDAGAGLARYADGNVSAVFHGHGVRVRTGQLDVVLLERLPYGVVGLRYADPAQPDGPRRPVALTLMAGTGFTYDPREAAAYAHDPYGYDYNVTQVPRAFELPLPWVKRLAEKGFFA